jgi:outer membrane protein assembly factor BamB
MTVNADVGVPETATRPRYWPGWRSKAILAFCLVVVVVVHLLRDRPGTPLPAVIDPAIINIITWIAGFISVMTLLIWLLFYSDHSRRVRTGVPAAVVLLLALAVATLRLDGFNGDMAPQFAWRWTPKRNRPLTPLETTDTHQETKLEWKTTDHDFPRFLGPSGNAHLSGPALARDWQAHPPKLVWKEGVGAGWSGFAVVGDLAYTLEQRGPEEWVTCYEVASGKSVWGHAITARHATALGGVGPRSTPTVHDRRVFAMGATGILRCLDALTGELLWQDDVQKQVGLLTQEEANEHVYWGRAGSPLIVDDLVVVPGGGKSGATTSLVAYRQADGEVVWKGGDKQIAYATPALATIAGQRQILICNEDTVAGHDASTGEELWTFPWPGKSNGNASASQAVALPGDRVFISKGYGGGCAVFQIAQDGDHWTATEDWAKPKHLKTKFTNVIVWEGHAYGLSDGVLECVELETGRSRWKRGRYGNGQMLGVADLLLVLSEHGELALVEATPEGYHELGQIQALEGQTWNTLCLTGNRLLIRNAEEAACYELAVAEGN